MVFLIAASKLDPAASNIAEKLLTLYPFKPERKGKIEVFKAGNVKLALLEEEAVKAENLAEYFPEAEAVAFASRHESASLQPTLTVHVPGDLEAGRLAIAWPQRMKAALKTLASNAPQGFKVSLEATHHGPVSLPIPVWFVEIGSSLSQWSDDRAGEAAAKALWASVNESSEAVPAVGFGGGH
ncbi:MAG: hypothetical protein DRO46_01165, partial [Candidatus Hecatellales archaeon]